MHSVYYEQVLSTSEGWNESGADVKIAWGVELVVNEDGPGMKNTWGSFTKTQSSMREAIVVLYEDPYELRRRRQGCSTAAS
jgi:hypothetical protein